MITKIKQKNNYRFERKFTGVASHQREIVHAIKTHPAFFREIFYTRQVNNIYLDTSGLAFFKANKIGVSKRKKVRIRWYGDLFGTIEKPTLEFKLKNGLIGDKWSFKLQAFDLDTNFNQQYLKDKFKASSLPAPIFESLHNLQPTLLNTYQRTYFLSADGQFRLTLDEQMEYHRIAPTNNSFLQKYTTPNQFVIEIKYGTDVDDYVPNISNRLPFRMDKSSKYVNGIEFLR